MKNNNQPTQTTTKKKKKAGIGFYLAWSIIIIFVLLSFGLINGSIYLIIGFWIFPPINSFIISKTGFKSTSFILFLVVLVSGLGKINSTYLYLQKLNQTSNTTLIKVSESQNSVKISEIIAQKEAETLEKSQESSEKEVEKKFEAIKDNPEFIYLNQVNKITKSNIEAGENHAKFVTNNLNFDEWTVENKTYVAVQIITMKNNYKKIQEIKPTEDYKEFHDMWIQASQLSGYADDDFVNGVDNKSTFLINSATTKNREATRQKSLAISMLKKISKNKGLEIE